MNNNYTVPIKTEINNSNKYFIVFTLNNNRYAINIQNVLEVINIAHIDTLSKTIDSVIGIFNYKNMLIKVIDLSPFLEFEPSFFSIDDKLIIVASNDNCFAIHVENIENIIQINTENIQEVYSMTNNSIIKESFKTDDYFINIININILNKLITENLLNENHINYQALFPSDEKSKQILKKRAQQNNLTQNSFSFPVNLNSNNQYLLFTLDNHNYYLELKHIKEVISIKKLNITRLPYTKDFIKGIINLKGNFLVVIDLKRFLNNDINNIEEGSKLIIAEGNDFNIAFLVDEIKLVKDLKNIQKTKVVSGNSPYIYSEFIEDDKLYSILNFDKIINDEQLFIDIK